MRTLKDERRLLLAKAPRLIRETLREFRRLTGFIAVPTLRSFSANSSAHDLPLPPVHPRCAVLLRKTTRKPPCEHEWHKHLRFGQKTLGCKRHTCPLGLRCACVPILLGEELLGFVKFVTGPEVSGKRFGLIADQLELLLSRPLQHLYISLLRIEVQALQSCIDRLQRAKRLPAKFDLDRSPSGCGKPPRLGVAETPGLISRVLDYLNDHFTDPALSLAEAAREVGKNEKYLAHIFAQEAGERMRAYVTGLRVRRACELLLATPHKITQIAREAGFRSTVQFRQLFHRYVGVTASEYRQVFASSTDAAARRKS